MEVHTFNTDFHRLTQQHKKIVNCYCYCYGVLLNTFDRKIPTFHYEWFVIRLKCRSLVLGVECVRSNQIKVKHSGIECERGEGVSFLLLFVRLYVCLQYAVAYNHHHRHLHEFYELLQAISKYTMTVSHVLNNVNNNLLFISTIFHLKMYSYIHVIQSMCLCVSAEHTAHTFKYTLQYILLSIVLSLFVIFLLL